MTKLINQFGGDIIVTSNYNEEKDATKTINVFLRVVSEQFPNLFLINFSIFLVSSYIIFEFLIENNIGGDKKDRKIER